MRTSEIPSPSQTNGQLFSSAVARILRAPVTVAQDLRAAGSDLPLQP